MEIVVEKTVDNVYLQRKEVHGKVVFQGATPSHRQFADVLAQKLGVNPETILVQHLYTGFGVQKAGFEAHVYQSKEQLERIARFGKKALEKLGKPAVKAKEGQAKAEAKPPVEAKKEEPARAEAKT